MNPTSLRRAAPAAYSIALAIAYFISGQALAIVAFVGAMILGAVYAFGPKTHNNTRPSRERDGGR